MRSSVLLILLLTAFSARSQTDDLRKSIYFDGGSYGIDEQQANDLLHWLDSIPNLLDKYQIQLISHTDPIGGKRYNEWLSGMRSRAVKDLLLRNEFPEKTIHIKNWGLEKPIYSNDSFKGMVMNRRVDVVLHPIVF